MSHSSKSAIAFAAKHSSGVIVAAGFSPILREAVARGASSTFSMPLCDDPLEQYTFLPGDQKFSNIVVGENPDWIFSGASLCGVIATKLGYKFCLSKNAESVEPHSVVLVLDSVEESSEIDIRRIALSMEAPANPEGVLGDSSFKKMEEVKPEMISGTLEELSSVISRRLRRITRS